MRLFWIGLLLVPLSAEAQYFKCGSINYFGDECLVIREKPKTQATPPTAPLPPMWEPKDMSPTAPEVATTLLADPTPENARAFAMWHLMRLIAIHRAQEVLEETMSGDQGIQALQGYFDYELTPSTPPR